MKHKAAASWKHPSVLIIQHVYSNNKKIAKMRSDQAMRRQWHSRVTKSRNRNGCLVTIIGRNKPEPAWRVRATKANLKGTGFTFQPELHLFTLMSRSHAALLFVVKWNGHNELLRKPHSLCHPLLKTNKITSAVGLRSSIHQRGFRKAVFSPIVSSFALSARTAYSDCQVSWGEGWMILARWVFWNSEETLTS